MINTSTMELLLEQFKSKKPYVIYSLPNSTEITTILQEDDAYYNPEDFYERAFVFCPFSEEAKRYCIPKEHAKVIKQDITFQEQKLDEVVVKEAAETKEAYISLLQRTIDVIHNRKAKKIVMSRKASFPITGANPEKVLKRLFFIYPNAFRYVWYHPDTGVWCGVTPELLMRKSDNGFKTMAVAGTKSNDLETRVEWTQKERDEHQYVVDDIVKKLQSVFSVIKVSKPQNHAAGPVVHLRTDIEGAIKKGKLSLTELASRLHPTSAICGTPRNAARQFIEANEGYDREFYAGFLGPLKENDQDSYMFVNLRCAKILKDRAEIFVGGGITKDSSPEAEWEETQNKMQTMLGVLQPFL
ncbi:MAG: isochorismate synthase [Alteromonas sp.]|nr:isochorismate synthase [Alteromonas sp.]MAY22927.1 isochorismate synthase [Flavobacteriaceae bacterium]